MGCVKEKLWKKKLSFVHSVNSVNSDDSKSNKSKNKKQRKRIVTGDTTPHRVWIFTDADEGEEGDVHLISEYQPLETTNEQCLIYTLFHWAHHIHCTLEV